MTAEEFMAQWPGATPDARFATFTAWIDAGVDGISDYLPTYTIIRDPATAQVDVAGFPTIRVEAGFFAQNEPAFAVAAGDVIISFLFQRANEELAAQQADWYEQQKEIEKLEKEYRKYLDKLWEKLLKDAKPKGDPGYADWYYSYYLPKYYGEYGSG